MKTISAVKWKLLFVIVTGLEVRYTPKPVVVFFLACLIILSVFTGFLLRWETNSLDKSSLKKNVLQASIYIVSILALLLFLNIATTITDTKTDYAWVMNMLLGGISVNEIIKIGRNIRGIDPKSWFSKNILTPFLKYVDRIFKSSNPTDKDES